MLQACKAWRGEEEGKEKKGEKKKRKKRRKEEKRVISLNPIIITSSCHSVSMVGGTMLKQTKDYLMKQCRAYKKVNTRS